MRTWPKIRPSRSSSTQAANASREAAAKFGVPEGLVGAPDNIYLPFGLAGTGGDQGRHRGVGADRRAVEDGLFAAGGGRLDGYLAGEAEVFGDGLAGVPALGDEDGDQDDVLRLDVLYDLADLRVLIQEPYLNQVVEVALPDAAGVEVDHPAGALVQIRAMPEQDERPPARRHLFATEQVLHTLQDHVGHPLERPQRPRVAHRLATLAGHGSGKPKLPGDHLLGKVPLRDKGRHHANVLRLDGIEDVAHGGLLLPEALDDLVVLTPETLSDARRVLVDRQARIFVQVRPVSYDNESLHLLRQPPTEQDGSPFIRQHRFYPMQPTNRRKGFTESLGPLYTIYKD